jgi:hypothetical protein
VTRNQKKNLQSSQRRLSIYENQSNAGFRVINQSFTSVRSSSQAVEEKLGREKKNGYHPTIPTGIIVGCRGTQCNDLGSSQVVNKVQCDIAALVGTSRVQHQRIVTGCQ